MDGSVIFGTSLRHGKLSFVSELQSVDLAGCSVRVVGRVSAVDFVRNRATITHKGSSLMVDVSLLETLPFKTNALVSFIGEIGVESGHTILQARVCRCVDGLSLDVWDKAVVAHRDFLARLDHAQQQQQQQQQIETK